MTDQQPDARSPLPPTHIMRAAMRVVELVGEWGTSSPTAQNSYRIHQSEGLYPPYDLARGEELLIQCRWLTREGDSLIPTEAHRAAFQLLPEDRWIALAECVLEHTGADPSVAPIPDESTRSWLDALNVDAERREALLLSAGRTFDPAVAAILGAEGEIFVEELLRRQLSELGRLDLADRVVRVSQLSDQLGYDIVAPRLHGSRRIEVKTSARSATGLATFHLSRNEIEWGMSDPDWALVFCRREDDDTQLVGFCQAQTLRPYLPEDSDAGLWTDCSLTVPAHLFQTGLPPVA